MYDIGFVQALDLALNRVTPLDLETVASSELVGRVCGQDVIASIDYPTADASLKDGYAVVSDDVARAHVSSPVELKVTGFVGAGDPCSVTVASGTAVRVLSGAVIPPGADAVLAEEFTEERGSCIHAVAHAEPGRNILARGTEITTGETLVRRGQVFNPALVSLLVAGGLEEAQVFRRPLVGLLATGDEVLLPGMPPEHGKLFASNLALQDAWLRSAGMRTIVQGVGDSFADLSERVDSLVAQSDVLLTSGGAWKGDRDLIVKVLESLGWERVFHHVRLGPGKAVAMGLLRGKPVFCLPGGPPSNEAAFLLIAFPALLRMAGHDGSPGLRLSGLLDRDIGGQADWTQVIHCRLEQNGLSTTIVPLSSGQRLRSMAKADALILVPEGVEHIAAGTAVPYLCLSAVTSGGLG